MSAWEQSAAAPLLRPLLADPAGRDAARLALADWVGARGRDALAEILRGPGHWRVEPDQPTSLWWVSPGWPMPIAIPIDSVFWVWLYPAAGWLATPEAAETARRWAAAGVDLSRYPWAADLAARPAVTENPR